MSFPAPNPSEASVFPPNFPVIILVKPNACPHGPATPCIKEEFIEFLISPVTASVSLTVLSIVGIALFNVPANWLNWLNPFELTTLSNAWTPPVTVWTPPFRAFPIFMETPLIKLGLYCVSTLFNFVVLLTEDFIIVDNGDALPKGAVLFIWYLETYGVLPPYCNFNFLDITYWICC